MQHSEQINELAEALSKAALKFPPIERGCTAKVVTKNGGSYSYDYADLDDVLRSVRGPLAENGLTLVHDHKAIREPTVDESGRPGERLTVETQAMLFHRSGQYIAGEPLSIVCDGTMAPAQLIGSACTYGRRYTTQAILGLSTEADDDGNGAGGNDASTGRREQLPACPQCGKTNSVIAGKPEYGGGLVCFKKKEGCGHTWGDEKHPLKAKDGDAPPPKKDPPAKPPATPSCKEYDVLAAFLYDCGCKTPGDATTVINWAVAGVGQISDLRQMAGECTQILTALKGCGIEQGKILEAASAGVV